MLPPPESAPKPYFGAYDRLHIYHDTTGNPTHYILRIEAKGDKKKELFPFTYGKLSGRIGWHTKAIPRARPLYNLHRLEQDKDAQVIVVEGEKSCDAAQRMFPNHVCVTWQGGCRTVDKTDWSPLKQRQVILWPDNDEAGRKAAAEIATQIPQAQILNIREDDVQDGGDAADIVHLADPAAWLLERMPASGVVSDHEPTTDETALDREFMSSVSLLRRVLPAREPLLGSIITRTGRMFIVGSTGTGKTMLGLAIAAGMAAGAGFLGWPSVRPARVLYIDGEMPLESLQERVGDACRRLGSPSGLPLLSYVSWADAETQWARRWAPFNTPRGQDFVWHLCGLWKPDVVIFDNVQALLEGDMRDEAGWKPVFPLIQGLTRDHIGQVWLDHAGHDKTKQYGTSTKAWPFDTVGMMTSVDQADRVPGELAFALSFEPPGKARNRTKDNFSEYSDQVIRLRDDVWSTTAGMPKAQTGSGRKTDDEVTTLLRTIENMVASGQGKYVKPRLDMPVCGTVTKTELRSVLIGDGWLRVSNQVSEPGTIADVVPKEEHTRLWKRLNKLVKLGKIGQDRDRVWLTSTPNLPSASG